MMCIVTEQPIEAAPSADVVEPTDAPAASRGGRPSMRERILEAAAELFYAQGIRAVSAEKIIARVGITKVTFYRHFPTKDELVVAYLERRAVWERDAVGAAREAAGGEGSDVFRLLAEGIGAVSCAPGFRGCPFINAAAEYADAGHPVRGVVRAHREWFKAVFEEMLAEAGVVDVSAAADQLMVLRDGAMVAGYLGDPGTVGRSLYDSIRAVIDFHR